MESPLDPKVKIPYILDILPHLQVGDTSPVENLQAVLKRWNLIDRPHIVADAAFGSIDILKEITEWGSVATLSCPVGNSAWLWETLSTNLPAWNWRGAHNEELQIVASVHAATDDKGGLVHQQLLSTGFKAIAVDQIEAEDEPEKEKESDMPRFTREALQSLTVDKLKTLCKTYNIRQGKKKVQFVENIFQRSEIIHKHSSALDKLHNSVQSDYLNDPAEIHDLYKEYFNLVDLADRRWYSVEEHHRHQKWQCKMVLSMLRTAVANCWVYASKMEYAEWLDWRVNLYKELMSQ